MTVEEEVLEKVRPGDGEQGRIEEAVEELLQLAGRLIGEMGLDAEPILVGSVAKGTHLRNPDIDLFIRFSTEVPEEVMQREVLALGERILEGPERRYAKHPYLRGRFKGLDTEVVPCYRVERAGARMSAVDRTPFHTAYIKERLPPALQDDVRLFKAFLKGIGVYGAEVAVEGFSGYLCEILVLRFGGFKATLEAAATWRRGVALRLDDGPFPKLSEPLIFIDPVDPARNVAAPVSDHSMSMLVHAARAYLRSPTPLFFFPNPVEVMPREAILRTVGDRETVFVGIGLPIPAVVEDIYASQLKKAERALSKLVDDGGYHVMGSWSFLVEAPAKGRDGRGLVVLEAGVGQLSAVRTHMGPEVGHPNEADFLSKWRDHPDSAGRPHIRGRRWFVNLRREHRRPADLVRQRIGGLNLGKHLSARARDGSRILDAEGLASEFPEQMSMLLDERFPWER